MAAYPVFVYVVSRAGRQVDCGTLLAFVLLVGFVSFFSKNIHELHVYHVLGLVGSLICPFVLNSINLAFCG